MGCVCVGACVREYVCACVWLLHHSDVCSMLRHLLQYFTYLFILFVIPDQFYSQILSIIILV